ncbi:MAG TPA: hypothetical protein VFE13_03835 [Caulobacteraceae bacterium]|jgi:hypothetical protein|nr:hypothetical protein [Caulobacteraceae bacterium]
MTDKRKTVAIAAALSLAAFGGLAALPQAAAAQPSPAMRAEMAAHPNMVEAIRDMQNAYRALDRAPDSFGGHKAAAMADLQRAIRSAKRALFYKIQMDDRAIDRLFF